MEAYFVELVRTNGMPTVVYGLGILWLSGKIGLLDKSVRERCSLLHREVDRRVKRVEDAWDGSERRR